MKILLDGLFKNNPIFKQMLGLCPTLAVTTSLKNGVGMGLATAAVLILSNSIISSVKNIVPSTVRIPAYIIIIATLATMVDLLMNAYLYSLHKVLGIFIPLIVVNCIVLGRAESFASKNNVLKSALDGFANGMGFTLGLAVLGACREILGAGTLGGLHILPESFPHAILFILPPGAFIVLGFLFAAVSYVGRKEGK